MIRMMNNLPAWLMFQNIAYSWATNVGASKTEYTTILGLVRIRKKMKNMSLPAYIIRTNFVTM